MKQADDDALVPTSPKDEETGLSAREKARKRVLERRKLREAQAKNEDGDGEDDDKKPAMDTTGLLGELGKDGDGTKLVRRATILRWADGASVFAMLAFMTCYVGFFGYVCGTTSASSTLLQIGTRTIPRFWRSRTPPEVCFGC